MPTKSSASQLRKPEAESALLLTRLPLEVRTMIWSLVVGGEVLHMESKPDEKKVSYKACQGREGRMGHGWRCLGDRLEEREKLLGLVLTCRQIYTEALDLLYGRNTFYFGELDTLMKFHDSLPHQHLSRIRSLHLHWAYCGPYKPPWSGCPWERSCNVLKSMDGLRELKVNISTMANNYWWGKGPLMLKPLEVVRLADGGVFEVRVDWPKTKIDHTIEVGVPWRLVRGYDWGSVTEHDFREEQFRINTP